MQFSPSSPPASVCLLRLSAIGDIAHTLPVVRTLQHYWPETRITWIIGKVEHTLVGDIEGIEFIIFDKARRWRAYLDVARQLKGRRFDLLLHMQMSMRASLISLLVKSRIKLGFDRARAKDGQWLFTNRKIAPRRNEHVVDSLFGFADALGLVDRQLRWDIPIPAEARTFANEQLPANNARYLLISPCSSMAYRDWYSRGYAEVAAHAIHQHGMTVVLSGGRSRREWLMGAEIVAHLDTMGLGRSVVNLIGATSLKQLLAILERASVLIAPDSGPAHLGTATGTPVIGLYACTNPDRARPYLSAEWVVNRYPQAIANRFHTAVEQQPWGTRVRDAAAMRLITSDAVNDTLDRLLASTGNST